jgi:hypothetical protein
MSCINRLRRYEWKSRGSSLSFGFPSYSHLNVRIHTGICLSKGIPRISTATHLGHLCEFYCELIECAASVLIMQVEEIGGSARDAGSRRARPHSSSGKLPSAATRSLASPPPAARPLSCSVLHLALLLYIYMPVYPAFLPACLSACILMPACANLPACQQREISNSMQSSSSIPITITQMKQKGWMNLVAPQPHFPPPKHGLWGPQIPLGVHYRLIMSNYYQIFSVFITEDRKWKK